MLFVRSDGEKAPTCHNGSPPVCRLSLSVTPTWHPADLPAHQTCCRYRPRCFLPPSLCCCHCQTHKQCYCWHSQHPVTYIKWQSRPSPLYLISFSRSRISKSFKNVRRQGRKEGRKPKKRPSILMYYMHITPVIIYIPCCTTAVLGRGWGFFMWIKVHCASVQAPWQEAQIHSSYRSRLSWDSLFSTTLRAASSDVLVCSSRF